MATALQKDFPVCNAQFAAELYNHLLTTNSASFLFCPLSVEIILALTHAGAYGKTAQQLSTRLHLSGNSEEIQQKFKKLTSLLKCNTDYVLSNANKIYIKDGLEIKDEFKSTASNVFGIEIENIDFEKKDEAVLKVNKWVEKKTYNKIKNLVSPNQIDAFTHTVLVTTMHFSGKWEKVFGKYMTTKSPFHFSTTNTVEIEMMNQKDYFRYYDSSELDAAFLEMPYEGEDVTINFVLPKDKEGLSKLESRVSDIFAAPQYRTHDVTVMIPKFNIEADFQFKPVLQALGIVDAFEDSADFSGIGNEPTKISAVIQKTFIEVDERGTTAAAATNCLMELPEDCFVIIPPPPPVEFIADHPFIFYLTIKNFVIFVGRFSSATD